MTQRAEHRSGGRHRQVPADNPPHVIGAGSRRARSSDQSVDFDQLTGTVIDGIAELGLPPKAAAALDQLRRPTADGLRNLVGGAVTKVVRSDAFVGI